MSTESPKPDSYHNPGYELAKKARFMKYPAELGMKTFLMLYAVSQNGLQGLKDIKDPGTLTGLIEGATIAPKLVYPSPRHNGLAYREASGGQWLAYDFNRPVELPMASKKKHFRQLYEGRILGFLPEELKDNPKDTRTRLGQLSLVRFDHFLTLNSFTIPELTDLGLVEPTTQEEAYARVGQEKHISNLRSRGYAQDLVHQVTPKGNTLLYLAPTGGDTKPKKEPRTEFKFLLDPTPETA